jgi:SAM-dependent methyltransferase
MPNDPTVEFYDVDEEVRHGFGDLTEDRSKLQELIAAEAPYGDELVLEVGCGTGRLSDLHPGWFGVDLGHPSLVRHLPGRSAQADARALPIASGSVAVLFSVHCLEHVPEPEDALREIDRVLRPGGVAYLNPAWFCSSWPMNPLSRTPYSDLDRLGSLRKLLGTARMSRPARLPGVLVTKARSELGLRSGRPTALRFGRLQPDLTAYQVPDADASASLEPATVASWYISRGYDALTYASPRERMTRSRGAVVVRKPGQEDVRASVPDALRCPVDHEPLTREAGSLACSFGHRYSVEADVPRLVPPR